VTYGPQPGDIFITTIHGRVGAGIGFAESLLELVERWKAHVDTVWRHAGIYVGDGLVIEAEPGGARLASLSQYDTDPVLWLRCPPDKGAAVAAAALTLKGIGYSYLAYDAITLHALHIPFPGLEAFIKDGNHAMCSQLADRAAMLGGWNLYDDGRWEGWVSPVDLALLAQKQPPP
jgi:hypothetical protein